MRHRTLFASALALTLALGSTAFAQGRGHTTPTLAFVKKDGSVDSMEMNDPAKVAMLMKTARKLPPGTLVYMSDGALYIAEDSKMPDGKMLSDALMH